MEIFRYETPTLDRKYDAIDYINEHYKYNSAIHGVGGLYKYVDNYEGWLNKLEADYVRIPNEESVPARTYFLVRESDNRIVGMCNIRLILNAKLRKDGGHIGYGVRPSERLKGYNKINLYLALKVCQDNGIKEALLDADINNVGSWKTMEALGGIRYAERFIEKDQTNTVFYRFDVDATLGKYKDIYDPMIQYEQKTL